MTHFNMDINEGVIWMTRVNQPDFRIRKKKYQKEDVAQKDFLFSLCAVVFGQAGVV